MNKTFKFILKIKNEILNLNTYYTVKAESA